MFPNPKNSGIALWAVPWPGSLIRHCATCCAATEASKKREGVQQAVAAVQARGGAVRWASKHDLNLLVDNRPHQVRMHASLGCSCVAPGIVTVSWVARSSLHPPPADVCSPHGAPCLMVRQLEACLLKHTRRMLVLTVAH